MRALFAKRLVDSFEHGVRVGQAVIVPETQHVEAGGFEKSCTKNIHIRYRLLSAIEFHNQASRQMKSTT